MRLGCFSANADGGMRPDRLAAELEGRWFDSMWLAARSHIPVERQPVPPFGADIPEAHPHVMDPFVSLAMAATATTSLTLATGVCMVLEHDVLDLAWRTATLDVERLVLLPPSMSRHDEATTLRRSTSSRHPSTPARARSTGR